MPRNQTILHNTNEDILLNLPDLFAAGTIEFSLSTSPPPSCDPLAQDGWTVFPSQQYIPYLKAFDLALFELEALVLKKLVYSTCRAQGKNLFIRIYLTPCDLPGTGRKLKHKDKETINALRALLTRISQMPEAWDGELSASSSSCPIWLLSREPDTRTLSEIYSDLPSPGLSCDTKAFEHIEGMRSTLYPYQRRSVAVMMNRELQGNSHGPVDDPLYVPLFKMNKGGIMYLNPAQMSLHQFRPQISIGRGGILCEELGTGKTIMVLALILGTINQLSSPEDPIMEERPAILSPLSYRHFPAAECAIARRRAEKAFKEIKAINVRLSVPTLVELMLHKIRASPNILVEQQFLENHTLWEPYRLNTPFYHHYELSQVDQDGRSQRKPTNTRPRTIFLTTATLLVVPANLIAQWSREIDKHVEIPLRVLLLKRKTEMPPVRELASDYDIVLITHDRISFEASKGVDVSKLHELPPCTCPESSTIRIPNCQCPGHPNVTPLLQIRWKRLVIDEGHVSATNATNLMNLIEKLNVERRWIVTGTPTTNLLGLGFGSTETPEHEDEEDQKGHKNGELQYPTGPLSSFQRQGDDIEQGLITTRRWTAYDREDLRKLKTMMVRFLQIPYFAQQSRLFDTDVIEPLLFSDGPQPGAIKVLQQVMEMVMIRHKAEDVEKDVKLPPLLPMEVVRLDLDPYAMKSYNALQAVIAINAVDSERQDQDYFFHPRNTESLKQTVENMSQFMFWGISDNLFNVDEAVKIAEGLLQTAHHRNIPEDDITLLQEALFHMKNIESDLVWRSMHVQEDIPFRVYNMPIQIFDAWTRLPMPMTIAEDDHFVQADRVSKIRNTVLRRPLIPTEQIIQLGHAEAEQDRVHRQLLAEVTRKKDRSSAKGLAKSIKQPTKGERAEKGTIPAGYLAEMGLELKKALEKLETLTEKDDANTSPGRNSPMSRTASSQVLAFSPLAKVRLGRSTSSKLNYILRDVLQYSPTEKFLVFSKSALTLAHVAEGLGLVGVKFLQFTTQVAPQVREQLVMTFETSETYRVFLMELKHGARGLNLVSASRVIFCEPVWQADVESQAIKRAHRIGQTRPITVKTLIIRNTAEENMLVRRDELEGAIDKLPDMTKEPGMRAFIANPKFLTETSLPIPFSVPLFDVPITRDTGQEIPPMSVTQETTEQNSRNREGEAPPKRSRVRFADE